MLSHDTKKLNPIRQNEARHCDILAREAIQKWRCTRRYLCSANEPPRRSIQTFHSERRGAPYWQGGVSLYWCRTQERSPNEATKREHLGGGRGAKPPPAIEYQFAFYAILLRGAKRPAMCPGTLLNSYYFKLSFKLNALFSVFSLL
jgi:hypothetical protein